MSEATQTDIWRFCEQKEQVWREAYGNVYHATRARSGWSCFCNGQGGRVFPSIKAFGEYIESINAVKG